MCNVILFVWNQLQHPRVAIVDYIIFEFQLIFTLFLISFACCHFLLLCTIVVGVDTPNKATQPCGVVDTPPPVMTDSRI
jgi:hypothetical protein